uniref:Uncharacterized protein n=1 Tax=viral metagenome TaxID=1070528 RepID=A0A6M3LT04_9ZZZZ
MTIQPHQCSPWTLIRPGDLVILLCNPRGYCAEVTVIKDGKAFWCLLDDSRRVLQSCDLCEVIPSGKTPEQLTAAYMPSAVEFDEAVDLQRGLIDFDKLKKRKTKGGTKKKGKKKVTKAQQQKLLELILQWQVKEATS